MPYEQGCTANLRVWLQTQQQRPFTTKLFHEADCAIYILDVTKSPESHRQKLSKFKDLLDEYCEDDIVTILIGNKFDLQAERLLDSFTGHELAKDFEMDRYIETSATRMINVNLAIDCILSLVSKQGPKIKNMRQTLSLIATDHNTTIQERDNESSSQNKNSMTPVLSSKVISVIEVKQKKCCK